MVTNGIPGPPLQRIQVVRQMFGGLEHLEQCQRRYGDVFRLHFPATGPVVVLAEPELVRAIYNDNEATLGGIANTGVVRRLLSSFGTTPMVSKLVGDEHLARRRLMLPVLHGDHLRSYERVMVAAIDERLDRWEPGDTVDMLAFARGLSVDIIVRVLFGAIDVATAARLRALHARLFSPWAVVLVAALLPEAARLDRFPGPWRGLARRRLELERLIAAQVRARRERPGEDVCSLLLAATDEDGAQLSEQQVSDELLGLGIGNSDTTVAATAWMFDHVLHDAGTLARIEGCPATSSSAVPSSTRRCGCDRPANCCGRWRATSSGATTGSRRARSFCRACISCIGDPISMSVRPSSCPIASSRGSRPTWRSCRSGRACTAAPAPRSPSSRCVPSCGACSSAGGCGRSGQRCPVRGASWSGRPPAACRSPSSSRGERDWPMSDRYDVVIGLPVGW